MEIARKNMEKKNTRKDDEGFDLEEEEEEYEEEPEEYEEDDEGFDV